MDKRNKTALAYLLIGVAAAGRALLSVPENAAIQEVSLTVLALVGYLLLASKSRLPVLFGAAGLVLELILSGVPAGGASVSSSAWCDASSGVAGGSGKSGRSRATKPLGPAGAGAPNQWWPLPAAHEGDAVRALRLCLGQQVVLHAAERENRQRTAADQP